MIPVRCHLTVQTNQQENKLKLQSNRVNHNVSIDTDIIVHGGGNPYLGPYTVTPTQSTQVLYTDEHSMTDNVTVNPIPSNYGLITWNGSVLTVS